MKKTRPQAFDNTPYFAPNDKASDYAEATPDKSKGKQGRLRSRRVRQVKKVLQYPVQAL